MSATEVQQVNLSTTDGEMGILANHVPTIAQLTPGVVEIMLEGQKSQKFFGTLFVFCFVCGLIWCFDQ